MPGQTLLFPSAGVVCDQPTQRCYDSSGLSIQLTGQYYGSFAAQSASQSLGGRRTGRLFTLSNGSSCDVRQRSCWNAGYGQQMLNQQLTSQLFGGMPQPGPAPTGYSATCRLNRSGSNIFNGPCALNEVRQGFQPRFEVLLQNGPRYVFQQTPGGYQISDGSGGNWPVQFSDNGRSGTFRWADMSLSATQNNYQPQSDPNSRLGRALGNLLVDLFN